MAGLFIMNGSPQRLVRASAAQAVSDIQRNTPNQSRCRRENSEFVSLPHIDDSLRQCNKSDKKATPNRIASSSEKKTHGRLYQSIQPV